MSLVDLFMVVPNPFLSALIWIVLLVVVMYTARIPAHKAILSLSRVIYKALRLAATSVRSAEARLAARNKEVLLAAGREATERIIEREFDRIDDTVRSDLSGYPALHRKLSEEITSLEQDHAKSMDVPPSPPGWVEAVEAVAKIKTSGDNMVGNILGDIHKSLVKAHEDAMEEYREATKERHTLLKNMMPPWRRVKQALGSVDKNVNSILIRSKTIDRHMDEYEEIIKGSDRAVAKLSSSSLVQFFVSAFVLAVAVGGAAINFSLIARPMAEMVGGTSFIGNFRVADVAALVIIMVEVSMGLFLMESLRITRLFPVIGSLKDQLRVRMIWITFTILLTLASIEAGLAYMRELLLHDELATSALLRGETEVVENQFLWITTAAQMGMGFILPFALVFVAIPLETFVHSMRTVLGLILEGILRGVAFLIRLVGNLFRYLGQFLLYTYDLLIFAPLWIERQIGHRSGKDPHGTVQRNSKLGEAKS